MKFIKALGTISYLATLASTAAIIPRETIAEQDTDIILFQFSMQSFLDARKYHDPLFDWSSDGCSDSPDNPEGFNFLPPCERHDFGYRNYKKQGRFTEPNRAKIDANFKKDMYNVCAAYHGLESFLGVECRRIADTYYLAVREFGG